MSVVASTAALPDSALAWAQLYTRIGLAITPLRPYNNKDPKGSKAPSLTAWQAPANWITQEDQCAGFFSPRGKGFGKQPAGVPGIGLIHEGSGTVSLDIDDLVSAVRFFTERGVDIEALLETTACITRGATDRAKGIFRLPPAAAAVTVRKVVVKYNGAVSFEFRGGHGHQDALPPTIHPSGSKFEWEGFNGTLSSFAELPQVLWEFWQNPDSMSGGGYQATAQAIKANNAAPWKPTAMDEMVLRHVGDVAYLLENAGYTRHTDNRFSKPGSDGQGIVIYPDGRAWSFHGSEPLYFNNAPHPLSPFDVFVGLMALERGQTKADTMAEACRFLQAANTGGDVKLAVVETQQTEQIGPRNPLWLPPSEVLDEDPINWPDMPSIMQYQGLPSIEPTPVNADRILRQHPRLCDVFRWDEFTGKLYVVDPPWRTYDTVSVFHRETTPEGVLVYLGANSLYRRFSHLQMQRAILQRAMESRRLDTLTNYVNYLPEWDGTPRVDQWLINYCGAENLPVNRLIGAKFLIGMVARALQPGCKMDNMMIMEGHEGRGKSTLFDVLAGRLELSGRMVLRLCTEQHLTLKGDDTKASEKMQGAWVAELPELSSFSKADRLLLVSFISRKEDAYRTPYDVGVTAKPRRIVLVGTTNETGDYLESAEGNRRFWPVTIKWVDIDRVAQDRDQLLAEALARYKANEAWWPEDGTPEQEALRELQRSRTSDHSLEQPGTRALVLLTKQVLEKGRSDNHTWTNKGHAVANLGLFFTSSELHEAIRAQGVVTYVAHVGRWLAKVKGWERGQKYDGVVTRYAYACDETWLDNNVANWRDTPGGRKYGK